jgi:hypothetical protein
MQPREKLLLGGLLLGVGLYALPMFVIMPMWADMNKQQATIQAEEQKLPGLEANNTRLSVEIARLKKLETVPTGVNVRKIEGGNPQASVKAMLDDLVTLAKHYGNDLIALTPFAIARPPAPEPESGSKKAGDQPAEPVPVQAQVPATRSFGYTFALRGTYKAIEQYVNVLSTHPELVEIQSITYQNEGGQHREQLTAGQLPTTKPIRAELKLVLYLQ